MKPSVRSQVLTTAFLFLMATYFLMPAWWLLVASTKSSSDLFGSHGFWFADMNLGSNLHQLFTTDDGVFGRWMANSVLYAVGGGAVATLLAAMAGYALAKYPFRGRGFVFSIILGAVLIPAPMLALPIYLMLSKAHLIDTVWAVLLPSAVSPFGVFLAKTYAEAAVPDELLEAARLDGASEFRIFRTIGLRIMSPALVTVFLFQLVAVWNNFFLPLITLNDQDLWPVTLGLNAWNSDPNQPRANLVVAGALVSVLPLVLAFLSLQRFWRSDLIAGGVKA
ncbi:carbohydrate ABC transporter permease [Yinghuangia seranimata]|uniref:carbohydrate ABC transporter permease n=1 Tax=Yinghuangia seranimata TaxID=408067 RepID=UPI00248CD121|nr:carbohydrate ABC transporter permease [Yinghuangia seranimata]MDI2125500.1 carbohydrate ABC transporter permease [Yinghuangia seranimata]